MALLVALAFAQLKRTPAGPALVITTLFTLALAALLLLLLYRLWALHRLDYWVDRDAVIIRWIDLSVILPLENIERIEPAPATLNLSRRWWKWPLDWIRPRASDRDPASFATQAPSQSLLLVTAQAQYLITPQQPQVFIEAVNARRSFGVARRLQEGVEPALWRRKRFLRDRIAQTLLLGGLLFALGLLAYLVWHFPTIPAQIPLHFNAAGVPDRIGPRSALFVLPAAALFIWLLNALVGMILYRYRRLTAYLLWGAAWLASLVGLMVLRKLLPLF